MIMDVPPKVLLTPPAIIQPAPKKLLVPNRPKLHFPAPYLALGGSFSAQLVGGGAAIAQSFSFVAAAGNTALAVASSITLPVGWAAGDLCCVFIWMRNSLSAGGIPAGFTSIGTVAVSGWAGFGYRILQSGDTTFTGPTASNSQCWITAAFRPTVAIVSVVTNSVNGESTTGDPVSQTITSGAGVAPLIAIGHMGGQTAVAPRTTSPAMDELNTHGDTRHYAHYKIYNSSPANHSYDMDDETTQNNIQSCYLTVT